ncbi:RHS repeat-associated core domain-containing protein [Burkholderia catarinensis]|uniref:RHS repeat-associated core domain-containing protein n=1 Tax=Burkholderia catarinensis TaxID=1108140 RepID=UPI000AA0D299|nr:RHS repeat-associated core domain-containing protein [Burkholderia catarinensis]KAG8150172.1 sugar-binding protein [Burkholderia catarinensis]
MTAAGVIQPKPTDVFVSPIMKITEADVQAGIDVFDKWLIKVSGGAVNVSRLKMVAENVPVLANIFAAVDAVLDIKEMIERGSKAIGMFDWVNLGLDLIGVVPLPPATAELRLGARPVLKLIRQEIVKSGKAVGEAALQVLRDSVVAAIVANVQERYAGEIEKFLKVMRDGLKEVLDHCAKFIGDLMKAIADLFAHAAGKKYEVGHNVKSAGSHLKDVGKALVAYDGRKVLSSGLGFLTDFVKIEGKAAINTVTTVANMVDDEAPKKLQLFADDIYNRIPTVQKCIRELDGNDAGKLGWLIMIGEDGMRSWRKRNPKPHATGIQENGTTKVAEKRAEHRVDTVRHTADAKHPGPNCCLTHSPVKTPPAATEHSIGFALGDEQINHEDFTIEGPLPIVWRRTYRSFFDANDAHGEFGARWITPYSTRLDIDKSKLVYHDATGRSLEYPLLDAGGAHDDPAEGHTLLRLDDRWLTLTRGHTLLETYERHDNVFRLAFVKDRAGNQVTLDYDAQGRLHRLIAPHSQVAFRHDARGRIVEVTHHDAQGEYIGVLARYEFNDENDLIGATDRYGNRREYRYRHHLVTRYTDRTGRGVNLEWNGDGPKAKCFREYGDDGSDEVTLAWHPNFRMVSVTDALGNVTHHYYDSKGYSFRVIHPDGSEEWMYRDENDRLVQYIHRDGAVEHMEYDTRGNLVRHQRTDGSVIEMAYDQKNQLVRVTDPLGHPWLREYDDAGNMVAQVDPLGHKTEFAYDGQGLVTQIKDAKGGTKALKYDTAGQLISYTDCSGKTAQWMYDAQGRLSETKDAAGGVTAYRYGTNGQLVEVVSPAGREQLSYDAEGRLLTHTDPLNRNTRYGYDVRGRINIRTDASGQSLSYRYDRLGRLVALTDTNHATYAFRYDATGRLIEEVDFGGKATRYAYDEASSHLESVDEAGQIMTISHDRGGRLQGRSVGDEAERFTYDSLGRLIEASNRHSRVQSFFDPVGNLVREHHAYDLFGTSRSFVWHHQYDEIGNRIKTVRPDGRVVDWLTYGSGHVHGMMLDGKELVQIERDDLHRETLRTLPSKIDQRTAYDSAGRLAQRTVQRANAPAALAERRYRYDAAGQLVQIEDNRKGLTDYRYDPVGRLLESIGPAGKERFAFDPASNIIDPARVETVLKESRPSPVRAESSLPPEVPKVLGNLLKQYAGQHFEYDARGNLVHRRSPAGEQRYEWNAFNRLTVARVKETARSSESRYYYDALGRRIAKEVSGERTMFGWDGDTLAYESGEQGSTHYLYEAESFVPMVQYVSAPVSGFETPLRGDADRYAPEHDPLQRVPERMGQAHAFYYHCDQIGTPQLLTDEDGDVVWETSYKAWGDAREVIVRASRAAGVAPKSSLRFQGQQFDEETGLHYNRNRYYDPQTSRFISKDPIGLAGGINVYQYAPNPIEWVDPLGLWGKNPISKYRYNTNGTLKSATAKIRPEDLGTGTTTNASSRAAARAFGCASDDAGHPIARNLGGLGGVKEVFPQDPGKNRGEFRDFEGDIADAVRGGSNVIVRVVPQYDVGSTRPHSVLYQARVDGQTESRVFPNPCPCKC